MYLYCVYINLFLWCVLYRLADTNLSIIYHRKKLIQIRFVGWVASIYVNTKLMSCYYGLPPQCILPYPSRAVSNEWIIPIYFVVSYIALDTWKLHQPCSDNWNVWWFVSSNISPIAQEFSCELYQLMKVFFTEIECLKLSRCGTVNHFHNMVLIHLFFFCFF